MTWQTISLADVPPSPWKNGGGVTRELAVWPNPQDWLWRMSVAEVASDGPFSRFDGIDRWFAVLSGAGVRLDMGPEVQAHTLTSDSAPLCFAGDEPVLCGLIDGATQDFNLMLRRNHASARMVRVTGTFSAATQASKILAVYAMGNGASLHFDDEVLNLPSDTLAWRHCPAGTRLQVEAAQALWMEIAT